MEYILRRSTFLIRLFSLVAGRSYAQLNSSRITQYTELNGVPGNEVNRVLVDRQGFVWVGSGKWFGEI